ncbi:COG4315 family predicted lipoprotein [Novilysobacter antarcticus]|uniref:COG4315 family predicted lipoprotein n=1 Tax=Novilysobacter antarcticus TaxID=2862543 RepID=UPI001C9A2659|nr:hypothetical protein [Lysobacter antarcticus]
MNFPSRTTLAPRNHRTLAALGALSLALTLGACDRAAEDGTHMEPPARADGEMPSPTGPGGTLVTDAADASGSLRVMSVGGPGDFVADNDRRAVYMLEGDLDGDKCTASCLTQWAPLFPPTGEPTVTDGLSPALIGTVERPDGSQQITYNEHPLYHFVGDTRPGDVLGHQRNDEWGDWYLLTPQGSALGEEVGKLETAPSSR